MEGPALRAKTPGSDRNHRMPGGTCGREEPLAGWANLGQSRGADWARSDSAFQPHPKCLYKATTTKPAPMNPMSKEAKLLAALCLGVSGGKRR